MKALNPDNNDYFKTTSPQGDGNVHIVHFCQKPNKLISKPHPRKGTETLLRRSGIRSNRQPFQNHIPARGRSVRTPASPAAAGEGDHAKHGGRGIFMRNYNQKVKQYAKEMRHCMTPEERRLWYDFLSKSAYHFRRQQPVGNFIVDFYSAALKFAIEVDGGQHFEEDVRGYDVNRTACLSERGIRLVRFTNQQIRRDFLSVCEAIDNAIADIVSDGEIACTEDDGHIY